MAPDKNLKFITNQKGKPSLLHKGRYNFGKTNPSGTSLWRCVYNDECSTSVTLNENRDEIVRQGRHSCAFHYEENERALMMNTCQQEVCSNMEPIKKIFENHVVRHQNKLAYTLLMPSYSEKKDSLYRARKKALGLRNTEFNYLEDVKIPKALASDFMVADSGDDDKILVFCSKIAKKTKLAGENRYFFGDGTFKRCPKPFKQFFSIHVDLNSCEEYTNIIPIIYALLPDKTEVTYRRLFTIIKDVLNFNIQKFKCDFEPALLKAFKTVFPGADVTGCYYHYNRAIWKKGADLNVTDKQTIRCTANLPLLPAAYTEDGWKCIVERAPKDEATKKISYFERQWVKSFSLICCGAERHRTNNSMEAWHRRMNTHVPHKATLILFLYILRQEAKLKDIRIKQYYFERSRRLRRHIQFDKKYKNEITSLQQGNITVLQFLNNIARIKAQILRQKL